MRLLRSRAPGSDCAYMIDVCRGCGQVDISLQTVLLVRLAYHKLFFIQLNLCQWFSFVLNLILLGWSCFMFTCFKRGKYFPRFSFNTGIKPAIETKCQVPALCLPLLLNSTKTYFGTLAPPSDESARNMKNKKLSLLDSAASCSYCEPTKMLTFCTFIVFILCS